MKAKATKRPKTRYWLTGVDLMDEWNGRLENIRLVSKTRGGEYPDDAVHAYIKKTYKVRKWDWDEENEEYTTLHPDTGNEVKISYAGCDRIPRNHYTVLRRYFNEV